MTGATGKALDDAIEIMLEEDRERRHAERYPEGCRIRGHRCTSCTERLGEEVHPGRLVRGGRGGRRAFTRTVCTEPTCPEYLQ